MYKKDGDKEAAVAALQDLHTAMFHGKGALQHLLEQNKPIHRDGFMESAVAPVFPVFGGFLLTYLSHEHRDLAILLKIILIVGCFFFLLLFLSNVLPRPSYLRANSHFFLRWARRLSVSIVWGLLSILVIEPTLLQTPRGQVSVAGFDFGLANLLSSPMGIYGGSKFNRSYSYHRRSFSPHSSGNFYDMPFPCVTSEKRRPQCEFKTQLTR